MSKAAATPLEDLDLSGDEVQRLTSAFQDPEFRRLFSEYAQELTDPENRRRYEKEITELERERGVEVRFVHPEPGYVLRTSLDGVRRSFVNVCSNVLVGAPSSRPGSGGSAPGLHWSLPHSLSPGREYAGRRGTRYTVYDVVFHPETLALARRYERFRHMLDTTALEAVEKQFGVKLDRRNAKTLKIKYKGSPEAAVLRTPLPGGVPARTEEESEGPLPDFPYPYQYPHPAASGNSVAPKTEAPSQPPVPTEPRYSVVQRHHVDLQDYRCSRDSVPSTVPHELVITIELPLLRSAEQAALEVTRKLLCLDSRKPDYRLRLSLPYPVDDSRGKAQFNKARRQLVVTLPVTLPVSHPQPATVPEVSADQSGTDCAARVSDLQGEAGLAETHTEDLHSGASGDSVADAEVVSPCASEEASPPAGPEELALEPEEQDIGGHAESPRGTLEEPLLIAGNSSGDGGGDSLSILTRDLDADSSSEIGRATRDLSVETHVHRKGTSWEPFYGAMGGPGTENRELLCPPLQCKQKKESLTLLIQVPQILPQSLQGDLSPLRYKLCFSTQNCVYYSFLLQFAPENKLSTREPVISISSDNAVIELTKSPESHGHWREWYYGINNDFLEVQECSNSNQLHVKQGFTEGSHLTQKENTEHLTTTETEEDHSLGNARPSDSSIADSALATDSYGSVACLQHESLDVSQVLSGKSQLSESKVEPELIKEKCVVYSDEEIQILKEPKLTGEEELDGDRLSSLQNKTTAHHISTFESIKETNIQDGSVHIIKDHVTQCAFSFQNSLLYDLD
ncbi:PREDICTED: protein kintoun isoform X2 [Chrysochloris asiatica]|uniref:Protein kintoun n=1 Tax=Chrysochloris asiatica TaxID=185453 RepID=A0A9B0WYA1_CHRAS|nr:PREDICTED: protein kintoun isoform X2 [Chrysochloris asiatica]